MVKSAVPPLDLEALACTPVPVDPSGFNAQAKLPFGLKPSHLESAMKDFIGFLSFVNQQLNSKAMPRLESMLMPANFSSVVGEFISATTPKYCKTLVKNQFHNGHPDLIAAGRHKGDAIQHHDEGIEIKASRYAKGWQGHNAEDCWLMVVVFASSRPTDPAKNVKPRPFEFQAIYGAQLTKADWSFAGRSKTSRRTITASVTKSGYDKMVGNWIYKCPGVIADEIEEDD
jgi:hypothetical protein